MSDGQGLTDFNRIQLNTKTASSESWGDSSIQAPNTGTVLRPILRVLTGSNFDKASQF